MSSNVVSKVVEQLLNLVKHKGVGWGSGFKIYRRTLQNARLPNINGALITSVPDSARRAGIRSGDVIINFDGVEISDTRSLIRVVGSSEVGKTVFVDIFRDGSIVNVKVKLGRFEEAEASARRNQQNSQIRVIAV